MFASRLPARIDPSPLARFIAALRASGVALLDLTGANPTRAGIVYPAADILAGFQDERSLVYNPEPLGLTCARERIAQHENVTADRVVLTTSTSEAYSWLFKLLCDPGDEVLIPHPSYPLFEYLAGLESVVARPYPLRYFHGWFTDTHALAQSVTARTKAVVVVNPNNPTGSYLKRQEQKEIAAICADRGLALISDEVFANYALAADPDRAESLAVQTETPLAFSLNGLSKLVGLPQMKLGWIVVSGEPRQRDEALERLELIADTFLSVGTPVQYALPALLRVQDRVQEQILRRLRANLAELNRQATGTCASVLRVEAGWSAIVQVPATRTEDEWVATLAQEDGVLVQPGYFYDFGSGGYLVVSLLTPEETLHEGIRRVLARVTASIERA